jgi:acyl-CoA reductase-like NAD-dependent aldehyde dehydrogenase
VVIVTREGSEVGRGLVAFDHDDARKIVGRHSRDIEAVLGYRGRTVLIHCDDMVVRDTGPRERSRRGSPLFPEDAAVLTNRHGDFMNARPDDFPLAAALPTSDLDGLMRTLGQQARAAAALLATVSREAKDSALRSAAARLRAATAAILHANAADLQAMTLGDASPAMIDRATLNPERVEAMAASLETIADLPDPVGSVIAEWDRPNGLRVQRVRTPLGVIGVIFESRPNVTADAGALCLKAGNAVILRGGSDTSRSAAAIHRCLLAGLAEAGLPEHAIQLVPTTDRAAVGRCCGGWTERSM